MRYIQQGEIVASKKDVADKIGLKYQTITLYLSNYKFTRHLRINPESTGNPFISLNEDFAKDFYIYLLRKCRCDEARRFRSIFARGYNLPSYSEFVYGNFEVKDDE